MKLIMIVTFATFVGAFSLMKVSRETYIEAYFHNHKSIPLEGIASLEQNGNSFNGSCIFRAVSTKSGFESQSGEVAFKKAWLEPVSLERMAR